MNRIYFFVNTIDGGLEPLVLAFKNPGTEQSSEITSNLDKLIQPVSFIVTTGLLELKVESRSLAIKKVEIFVNHRTKKLVDQLS